MILALAFACTNEEAADTDSVEDVGEANEDPVAVDDASTTRSEVEVELWLTLNDTDPNEDNLKVAEIVQPENGFVELQGGEERVTYTSVADFVGLDTFEYTVSDGNGGTDTATVTIKVDPLPTLVILEPVEDDVVAGPDVEVTFEVDGCDVTPPNVDAEGCHVHKFLDGNTYTDADGNGFGHYYPDPFTLSPVDAGEHEFTLVLVVNDGSDQPFEPYISDTVTFTVSE